MAPPIVASPTDYRSSDHLFFDPGTMIKLIITAVLLEVFEEKKVFAEEVNGNVLELLDVIESLRRQNRSLQQRENLVIILFFSAISAFLVALCFMCKQNSILHQIEENQQSPTNIEVRELADETRNEIRVSNKLSYTRSLIGIDNKGTSVYRGRYDNHVRAIKRLLCTHDSRAKNEIELLLSVNHINVIRCFGYESNEDFTFIVLEVCDFSLEDFIKMFLDSNNNEKKNKIISLFNNDFHLWKADGNPSLRLITLIKDIFSGLKYLHNSKFIHRDLKPSNVLILIDRNKNLIPKLADLGVSKLLVNKCDVSPHVTDYGTSCWLAPELLSNGRHDTSVYIFSLGCLIFFCITKGKHPFGDPKVRDANIEIDNPDLTIIKHMPEAFDLISKLLKHNPSERYSLSSLEIPSRGVINVQGIFT